MKMSNTSDTIPRKCESEAALEARSISFRPIREADRLFLERLYASTRETELAALDWSPEQKAAFLQSQFAAQSRHYATYYPEADFWIVLEKGEPIGRLYLSRWEREIRVIDIALVPERRGHGIGTALMNDILAEAAAAGKHARIHVERNNPALRLYKRLGFRIAEDKGVYFLLEWRLDGAGAGAAN